MYKGRGGRSFAQCTLVEGGRRLFVNCCWYGNNKVNNDIY